ncbi:unnamed protein product, partial [Brenthis ino]
MSYTYNTNAHTKYFQRTALPNSCKQITEYQHACYILQFPEMAKLRNNIVVGFTFGAESSIVIIEKAGLRAVSAPTGPLRRAHPDASYNYANVICATGLHKTAVSTNLRSKNGCTVKVHAHLMNY